MKIRNQVYTSNEMRRLWEQLFLYHSGVGHHEAFLHMKKKERHRRQSTGLKRLVMDRKSLKFNVTNYEGGNREEGKRAVNDSSESSSRLSGSDSDSEFERAFEDTSHSISKHHQIDKEDGALTERLRAQADYDNEYHDT